MVPEPLHPAVVHFPIVLGLALPVLAALAVWRIHDGAPVRVWGSVVIVAVLALGAGFVAEQTGSAEEDRVEDVVGSPTPIHEHEEAAELFVIVSGVTAGLALVGFFPGLVGRAARLLAVLAAVAGAGAVARAGLLGGELVYRHGAAAAYSTEGAPTPTSADGSAAEDDAEEESER